MSVVGPRYTYDVFFSYAWAIEETHDPSFRDWCRAVADDITKILRQSYNHPGQPEVRIYLDRDMTRSAQDLRKELQGAAENSAIFVALVSNFYESEYCRDEAAWFCEKLAKSGADFADHVCVLRVQDFQTRALPPHFLRNGEAPLYLNFCDDDGQPTNMPEFLNGASRPDLAQPIRNASLEIKDKIKKIREKEAALVEIDGQLRPDEKIVFVEAETRDLVRWSEVARQLQINRSIILPEAPPPTPATAIAMTNISYGNCDGLLMLRCRTGDDIKPRVTQAYRDRREMLATNQIMLPWVLLDDHDPPDPICVAFKIPRVRAEGDWAPAVKRAMFGA